MVARQKIQPHMVRVPNVGGTVNITGTARHDPALLVENGLNARSDRHSQRPEHIVGQCDNGSCA